MPTNAQRRVTIEDPFAVGVYEVTFAEWDARALPPAAGGRVRQPVIDVSWNDAQQYVAWLSSRTGCTRTAGTRFGVEEATA